MKNRLQKLWKQVVPAKCACPQPDAEDVLRRVCGELDGAPKAYMRRRVIRHAVLAAAALLLLTMAAIAANPYPTAGDDVLSVFFFKGENAEIAGSLVDNNTYSISDGNYTLTVTSTIADHREVYYSLAVSADTEEAKDFLENGEPKGKTLAQLMEIKTVLAGDGSGSSFSGFYDRETNVWDMSGTRRIFPLPWNRLSVRFIYMEEGMWLHVPIRKMPPIKLKIGADGQGIPFYAEGSGGPVTLNKLKLTPMSVWMDYTTPFDKQGMPLLYFLWKDGSVSTAAELGMSGPSGSGSQAGKNGELWHLRYTWDFGCVQDLTRLEAVIFEGLAYPVSGGKPYAVGADRLPAPFYLPAEGDPASPNDDMFVPLFALCEGLGIPCGWDEETGTASAEYRGVRLTFTEGSTAFQMEGAEPGEANEPDTPTLFRDDEFWVDAAGLIESYWHIQMNPVYPDGLEGAADGGKQEQWFVLP